MTNILSELHSGVLTLTIHRPPVNALDVETVGELLAAFKKADHDNAVRCILLTGAGKAFSAGHEIGEMFKAQSEASSYRAHLQATYNPLILQIRRIGKPVVAAVNGPAAGAGLGIALACDLRIAAETAQFTVGFSGIGLAPDSGVSLFLPLLIGLGRATEFAFTNEALSAKQALEWGLVNRLTTEADLGAEAAELAKSLAAGATGAFGLAKRAFNRSVLSNLEDALDYESQLQEIASQGGEHHEGVQAFIKKRLPEFQRTSKNEL